jgi:hypothetical protein
LGHTIADLELAIPAAINSFSAAPPSQRGDHTARVITGGATLKPADIETATSSDWVRGYKWALAGGDPPGRISNREMFMRGYDTGKEDGKPKQAQG